MLQRSAGLLTSFAALAAAALIGAIAASAAPVTATTIVACVTISGAGKGNLRIISTTPGLTFSSGSPAACTGTEQQLTWTSATGATGPTGPSGARFDRRGPRSGVRPARRALGSATGVAGAVGKAGFEARLWAAGTDRHEWRDGFGRVLRR